MRAGSCVVSVGFGFESYEDGDVGLCMTLFFFDLRSSGDDMRSEFAFSPDWD
jgi:hypothetical protein